MIGIADRLRDIRLALGELKQDVRGVIALKFALIVPAVALLAVGAIDLMAVNSTRDRLQDLADSAALAGAPSLSLATSGTAAQERAAAFFQAQMTQWQNPPTVVPTYTLIDQGGQRALRVVVKGHRASFFGSMLPPGGWNFTAQATASTVGLVPLCVLVTGRDKSESLLLSTSPRINAPGCMVHSNQNIAVKGGSITAAKVQAVGTATGVISPQPGTGASQVADPFARLAINTPTLCDPDVSISGLGAVRKLEGLDKKIIVSSGTLRLPPGVHCGIYEFAGTSELILEPGDHWFFASVLIMREQSKLSGRDVVLFFDKPSKFEFLDRAMVNLSGRESGAYAGIVVASTRDNIQKFVINADRVETLLGVIYIPEAHLLVEGTSDVSRNSAWTVILAKYLELKGSPSLYINASYGSATVPVPSGVGPNAGAHLVD
jgi:hypothetical protein